MRSAARPVPSQTTTGTGGVAVTYSNIARIVFVPPSITRQTNGVENALMMIGCSVIHLGCR